MTREEWANNRDFDEISREMNGLYSGRQLTVSDMIVTGGTFLRPTGLKADMAKNNQPTAE